MRGLEAVCQDAIDHEHRGDDDDDQEEYEDDDESDVRWMRGRIRARLMAGGVFSVGA